MDRSPPVGQTRPPKPTQAFQAPPEFPPLVLLAPDMPHESGLTPPVSPPAYGPSRDLNAASGGERWRAAEISPDHPRASRSQPDAWRGAALSPASARAPSSPAAPSTSRALLEQSMPNQQLPRQASRPSHASAAPDRVDRGMPHDTSPEAAGTSVAAAIQRELDAYDVQLSRIRPMLTHLEQAILDNPEQNNKELARANNVSEHTVWERRQAFLRCGLVTAAAYGGTQEIGPDRQKIREGLKERPWIESKDLAKRLNVSYPLVQSERRIMERTDQFRWALGLTDEPPATRQRPPSQPLQVWTVTRPDGTLVTVRPEDRQEVLDRLHPGTTTYELLEPLERRYGPIGYSILNRWLGL